MALITDESGNAEYPQTYTSKVFDKNGNAINDRVVYGEPDGSVTVEPMSPILHQSDVVNNLTSTSTTTPLSAAMGTALNSTLARKPELVTMHVDSTTTGTGAIGIAVSYTGYIYVSSLLTVGYPGHVERRDTNYLTVYNNDNTVKANEAVVFDAYFLKV